MDTDVIFMAVCGLCVIIMILYYRKRPNRLLSAVFGAFSGIAALLLLSEFGGIFGISAELNPFNLAAGAVLGVPYSACLIIMNFL